MCTCVYACVLLCTLVYCCVFLCTLVYSCVPLCTLVYPCVNKNYLCIFAHNCLVYTHALFVCCCISLYTYVYVVVSGRNQPFEDLYGLKLHPVPGDGHCLFHTLARLDKSRSYMEWRSYLCDEVVQSVVFCCVLCVHCVWDSVVCLLFELGIDMHKICHTTVLNSLCKQVEKNASCTSDKKWYLDRANDSLQHVIQARESPHNKPYTSLDDLLQAMRTSEWGYSDFIQIFCNTQQVSLALKSSHSCTLVY